MFWYLSSTTSRSLLRVRLHSVKKMKRHQTVYSLCVHWLVRNEGYCVKPDRDSYGWGLDVRLYKIDLLQRSECLGHRWMMQVKMQGQATGNQKMNLGCPVQGSCRIGCNTGSTGSGSGSIAATAEHTGGRNRKKAQEWEHVYIFKLPLNCPCISIVAPPLGSGSFSEGGILHPNLISVRH